MNSPKRAQIVSLRNAGVEASRVAKLVGVCRKTVFNTMRRFNDEGNVSTKSRSGRPRTKRTKRIIRIIEKRVKRNPRKSLSQLGKGLNISKTTAHRAVHNDLGLRSYKLHPRHAISRQSAQKRLSRSKLLLEKLTMSVNRPFIWSDEKIFTIQPALNRQNDRIRGTCQAELEQDLRLVTRAQSPASIMVWAAVASDGRKSPLVFIDKGAKVNSDVYIKILSTYALPWLRQTFSDGYIFTQDGAPAHTSKKTQTWCRENFVDFVSKDFWPPSSPDINPMDFSVWSILESDACSKTKTSLEGLKKDLRAAWRRISEETVRAICDSVEGRLRAVVKAKGFHIE